MYSSEVYKKFHSIETSGRSLKIYFALINTREIEQINDREKRSSSFLHLSLEFSRVHFDGTDFTVVYFEKNGDEARHFHAQAELVLLVISLSRPSVSLARDCRSVFPLSVHYWVYDHDAE